MSWVVTGMVIGGAAVGAGSYLSNKKGKVQTNPYGTLNPEQVAITKQLGPELQNRYMNAPLYNGDYTAEYTPTEQANLERQSRLSAMNEGWSNQFQPGQINPEVDANEWRNLNQKFYGDGINPGAKALTEEQYAGSGGFWGTPRANATLNEYNASVVSPYRDFRSQALQNSYGNALNYASGSSALNQATGTMAATPRLIQQYGLDQQYNEWIRGESQKKEYVDKALNFLNISTVSQYQPGAKQAFAGAMLQGLGNGISMAGGLSGTSGGTTATPNYSGSGYTPATSTTGGLVNRFNQSQANAFNFGY